MAPKNGKQRSNFDTEMSVLRQCKRLLDTLPSGGARGRVLAYLLQSDPGEPPADQRQDELPFGAS